MKLPKPTLKKLKADNPDAPKYELDKIHVRSKTKFVDTREKAAALHLAKERDQLIERKLVTNQLTFLFLSMRAKMLSAPLGWHRKCMHITNPHVAVDRLWRIAEHNLTETNDD
jgi:phage terminase Nu1 subunit (DNA packaging protein)